MSPAKKSQPTPVDLTRYIKTRQGDKAEMHTTSVNITERQRKFLIENNLNLSLIIRDVVDALMVKGEK